LRLHEFGVSGCAVGTIFDWVIVVSEELERLFFGVKMFDLFRRLLIGFFAFGYGEAEVVACVGQL
jgi:uncharacterized membrane protein